MFLIRYVDLWRGMGMGHQVVYTRPKTRSIVVPTIGDRAVADFLYEIDAAKAQQPRRPLVFHIFRLIC